MSERDRVVAALTGVFYAGKINLTCPVCRHDYSHIREVFSRLGSDEYEGGIYPGTPIKGVTAYRRSALVIALDGECGHRWNLIIQQHKGVNIVELETEQSTGSLGG